MGELKPFKILIFSDSLANPRNKGTDQVLPFEKTWPFLMREEHPEIVVAQVSIGSATTEEILYQTQYWTGYCPDLVLFQLGLCDCLPRALKKWELEWIKQSSLSKILHDWMLKHSVEMRKIRNRLVFTDKETFEDRVKSLQGLFERSYWISIVVRNNPAPVRFPHCKEIIDRYNQILKSIFKDAFIDLDGIPDEYIMCDDLHLNEEGHRYVWSQICEKIDFTSLISRELLDEASVSS